MTDLFYARGITEEEKSISRLKKIVPNYALYSFAELSCKLAKEVCNAILDPRNPRNRIRPIDECKSQKVEALCHRIKEGVDVFYDGYVKYLSNLQESNYRDVFESMALSNEEVERINGHLVVGISNAIDKAFAGIRPLDPHLFSALNRLLYISSLFVKYRKFLRDTLGASNIETFRLLDIDKSIRRLVNELQLKDKSGKTLIYLYTYEDVRLFSGLTHRRAYKGIELAKTTFVDVLKLFEGEEIDRCQYSLIKSMFALENIDKICAAGNDGHSPMFSKYFHCKNFIGCMSTFEQYSLSSSILTGDIQLAYKRMKQLRELYEGDFIVCYRDTNGQARFDGVYITYREAAEENEANEKAIIRCVEKNDKFRPGKQLLHKVKDLAFFRMSLLEDYFESLLNKKAS